jgi:hypothetical protein
MHAFCTVWNASELCSIPEPRGKPPPGSGSGKFVTPCARMHCVNLRPLTAEDVVPPEPTDDPHASTSAQLAAA